MNEEQTTQWQPLPAGLPGWWAEYPIQGWRARTTAIRLRSGGLLIVNPGKSISEQARRELASLGPATHLLALNSFHHLGVVSWRETFGPVPVLAAAAAHSRLQKQLGFTPGDVAEAASQLPSGVEIVTPEGLRTGEAWVVLRNATDVAWVVCDAFFHLLQTPRSAAGLFLRLSGTTPGLRIGATFKWGHVRERPVYREWVLRRLEQDQPSILVPAHGEVLEDRTLPERLRALIEARLQ